MAANPSGEIASACCQREEFNRLSYEETEKPCDYNEIGVNEIKIP